MYTKVRNSKELSGCLIKINRFDKLNTSNIAMTLPITTEQYDPYQKQWNSRQVSQKFLKIDNLL